jgi:hypothetical protein
MNTMNQTAKMLFNALSFANVSTLGELHTLLRQIDEPGVAVNVSAQPGGIAQAAVSVPPIGHIQGAL